MRGSDSVCGLRFLLLTSRTACPNLAVDSPIHVVEHLEVPLKLVVELVEDAETIFSA